MTFTVEVDADAPPFEVKSVRLLNATDALMVYRWQRKGEWVPWQEGIAQVNDGVIHYNTKTRIRLEQQ